MKVAVFLGSDSDFDVIEGGLEILKEFGVPFSLEVTSAHRSPERTLKLIRESEGKGAEVFIAVAGKAAHLAGVIAGHTRLPVIGLPLGNGPLSGWDSLLSTVQMPPGVPVATVAIDGARNAAVLAGRILALKYPAIDEKLKEMARIERERYDQSADEALAKLGHKG